MFQGLIERSEQLARVQAHRAALRFVNGIEWMLRDSSSVVGRTPFDVVYQRDKLQVRHYHAGSVKPRYPIPVLLVPPLMVKPFIFDLYPGRSLVATLIQSGYRVYLVDFGEPDDADAYVSLDNYVLDWMPTACAVTKEHAGASELSLVGYCMGGLFALMHIAANEDDSVLNIVTIGAPIDASKLGVLAWAAKYGGSQVEFLARKIGNVPGGLSSTAFRLLTPMKNFTRYADLFMNLYNEEYVNGFDAMNQWVGQFIDYPQAAFLQFTREFMRQNKLVKGKMRFGEKVADLRRVKSNLLAFAGNSDSIAPVAAARAVDKIVSSSDKTFLIVPGGHMGVFAGSGAPANVWQPIADWLAPRSRLAGRASAADPSPARLAAPKRAMRKAAAKSNGGTPAKGSKRRLRTAPRPRLAAEPADRR
ncbi:MAG TPA: alpha/beta fold hydrolase [Terriglobales bacterium]|nr:alpha/beta fold hydrolase [Terriglobales bacterium]